jgi:type II secretory pathway pseudopilin PulG
MRQLPVNNAVLNTPGTCRPPKLLIDAQRVLSPMPSSRAFTFIEVVLAVFILMLLLSLAVPSLHGVAADKRLRRSLDSFNELVRQAQERSVTEQRAYLIVWEDKKVVLRPEEVAKEEEEKATTEYQLTGDDVLQLNLPAALAKKVPSEWIFWSSGTCEPATVGFKGADGSWTAKYSALTCRPELTNYVAR